jgi:hypothetical protein
MPLLSAFLVAANVLTGAAACAAVCSSTRLTTDDCCKRPDAGISAPRCCQGAQQLASATAPAVASRGGQASAESAAFVACAVPAVLVPSRSLLRSHRAATAAPPGAGALVAQHTSLLL